MFKVEQFLKWLYLIHAEHLREAKTFTYFSVFQTSQEITETLHINIRTLVPISELLNQALGRMVPGPTSGHCSLLPLSPSPPPTPTPVLLLISPFQNSRLQEVTCFQTQCLTTTPKFVLKNLKPAFTLELVDSLKCNLDHPVNII